MYFSTPTKYPKSGDFQVTQYFFLHRREAGMCRICWSADNILDVGVTGKTAGKGVVSVSELRRVYSKIMISKSLTHYISNPNKWSSFGHNCIRA